MRHDGKRLLQLYVSPDTLRLIRDEAKARKVTMSAFVTDAVTEEFARNPVSRACVHCGSLAYTATSSVRTGRTTVRCDGPGCGKRPW